MRAAGVAFAVAAAALALTASAASGPPDEPPVLSVPAYVHVFAADGSRVAFSFGVKARGDVCEGAAVWEGSAGAPRPLPLAPGREVCAGDWAGTETLEVAVAGPRVTWLAHGATLSSSELDLYTARLGSRRARLVMRGNGDTFSGDNVEYVDRRLGLLAGDEADTVFLSWTVGVGGKSVRDERLWRINSAGALRPLGRVRGARSLTLERGTAAVLATGGKVTFVPVNGGERRALLLPGLATRMLDRRDFDLRLSDGRLVVLTESSVDVYDASSGEQLASWPIGVAEPSTRGVLDVEGDYASFLVFNGIHVLRLSDGLDAAVPVMRIHPPGCEQSDVWAQLEPVGLVYSQSRLDAEGCRQSRLGTVSFAELDGLLRP